MNDDKETLAGWFSTYGIITAKRIFEQYKINLSEEDLAYTLKTSTTFYHQLLQVPLKNVYNGIILQQTYDYQVYAQKLFIDYLLSGENGKEEGEAGGNIRKELEEQRKYTVNLSEKFRHLELQHEDLIANSQSSLIQITKDWQAQIALMTKNIKDSLDSQGLLISESTLEKGIIHFLAHHEFNNTLNEEKWSILENIIEHSLGKENRKIFMLEIDRLKEFIVEVEISLEDFHGKILELSGLIREFRSLFYQAILKINELIKALPEYPFDYNQIKENRESILFDSELGKQE